MQIYKTVDYEEQQYFEYWNGKPVQEKLCFIEEIFFDFITCAHDNGEIRATNPVDVKVHARRMRIGANEAIHYLQGLSKNLEAIEMSGDWK